MSISQIYDTNSWWQIFEYDEVLTRYWEAADDLTRDDLWTSLQLLREYGNRCPSTISEALGHDSRLFSLKAKSRSRKIQIRMIYFFFSAVRKQIIFVDVIEKKKRALVPCDLKTALRRKASIETGNIHAKLSSAGPLLSKPLDSKNDAERARLLAQLTRKEVAGQIRQLREKRKLTQVEFATQCKMKQSAVSRIEQADYSGWTYKTLARIAEKLHARLRITYEPLEELAAEMAAEDGAPFQISHKPLRTSRGSRKTKVKRSFAS